MPSRPAGALETAGKALAAQLLTLVDLFHDPDTGADWACASRARQEFDSGGAAGP